MSMKSFKFFFSGAMLLSIIISCEKNNLVVDQDPLTVPEAARFVMSPTSSYYNYYITQNPTPGSIFKIPIGVTTVTNTDRKVKFTYSSVDAVEGTHYIAIPDITIPAGSAIDTLFLQGIFSAYPAGRMDTLKIRISNADSYVVQNAYQDSIFVILQSYCPVILSELGGDYDNTFEGTYGPYTSSVTNLVSTSPTTAEGKLENVYDSGITASNVVFNWTSAASFTVTIPEQNTGLISSGYQVWIRTSPGGTNTFSSCLNTITLTYDLIAKTASGTVAGYFAQNYRATMAK